MEAIFSKMLKAGSTTFFLDVREAKNQKKFFTVTASVPSKEGESKFKKSSVLVFGSVAEEFVGALKEAQSAMGGEGEFTRKLKSGRNTYFIDVKEAKNNSRYVSIAESHPSKEDPKKLTKQRIVVFDNVAKDFVGAVEEVVGLLK